MTVAHDDGPTGRSSRAPRLAEAFGSLQGIVTGVLGGALLWVFLAWFAFVLLRGLHL